MATAPASISRTGRRSHSLRREDKVMEKGLAISRLSRIATGWGGLDAWFGGSGGRKSHPGFHRVQLSELS